MSRVRRLLTALGVAFALPALTGARALPVTTLALDTACKPQSESEYQDARWLWRMRAFQHLDCITTIVDGALQAASSDRIELSRAEVERIRVEARYARDAAARIGL